MVVTGVHKKELGDVAKGYFLDQHWYGFACVSVVVNVQGEDCHGCSE